ncbi:MAG: phosphoadenylyl-sulfate reductase [Rhodoferax sp.]
MSATERNARASADFDAKLSQTRSLLQQTAMDYAPAAATDAPLVTHASSLGAEDVVISHLINALSLEIPIFVLDTGALHPQTIQLLDRTRQQSRAPVKVFGPDLQALQQFVAHNGIDAIFNSVAQRKACCRFRKMEPLARALDGKAAWITGLRREQSGARAQVQLIDTDDGARVKINPLAYWTWGDVWHFIATRQVPYNPLHDQFYPSIGCAPCTRAISQGEDFRSGRWWWEDETAKECGLHVAASPGFEIRSEGESL